MVTGRCPIKDLPDKENAPDFDDTLRGELGSTSASVIVRTISIPIVSRILTGVYDTETFVIFFSKSSKQVHCTQSYNK